MTKPQTRKLQFGAYSAQQDGTLFDHVGTVEGARRKALAHAKEAFPAWGYRGYGPTLVVVDATTGERLVEQRL